MNRSSYKLECVRRMSPNFEMNDVESERIHKLAETEEFKQADGNDGHRS